MQTKLRIVLCIIITSMIMTIIIGCIYKEQKVEQQINSVTKVKHDNVIVEDSKKIDIETDKEDDTNQAIEPVNLGNFKLTAYCSCSLCCGKWANNRPNGIVYGAIGEELKEGYSIAVDPEVISYKTEVIINGTIYKAQDCGGGIKGNEIDIYFEDHNDALDFGVQYADVFIKM